MNKYVLQCPICLGGGELIHVGTRDNDSLDIYRCRVCGVKFLSEMKIDNDYENGFMYQTNTLSDLTVDERLQLCKKDDTRRFEMVKDICFGKRVMDFGCGFGGFLKYISGVADSCCGVDLGRDERNYLSSQGIRCYRTLEESARKYDVITLFHTFEHLSEPQMWLDKFSEYLVCDGYLVIEVPHADDILLSLYENSKFADFTYWSAHFFLYTDKSLSMLIKQSGKFEIELAGQVQRYTIANHLMWLAKGLPGGHNEWNYLDSEELNEAYTNKLKELRRCDTLFYVLRRK